MRTIEDLHRIASPVKAISPGLRLLMGLSVILTAVSFPAYDLLGPAAMLLFPLTGFAVSLIPPGLCFYRLRYVMPFVLAVGLFNPFFDRQIIAVVGGIGISGGVISMITLILKGLVCLMTGFWMSAAVSCEEMARALTAIRCPRILVTLLVLTRRYISVLAEEAAIMQDAYRLRAPAHKGIHVSAWGSFLGQLILRSLDRAERLYESLQLRGFDGSFPPLDTDGRKRSFPAQAAGIGVIAAAAAVRWLF